MLNDTICAISTALKDGAISIVRMSGDGCFDIVKKISDVKDIRGNTIVYSHIYDEGEMIDEVLISFFEKGKSYTREDMAEINCHGGVYVPVENSSPRPINWKWAIRRETLCSSCLRVSPPCSSMRTMRPWRSMR